MYMSPNIFISSAFLLEHLFTSVVQTLKYRYTHNFNLAHTFFQNSYSNLVKKFLKII